MIFLRMKGRKRLKRLQAGSFKVNPAEFRAAILFKEDCFEPMRVLDLFKAETIPLFFLTAGRIGPALGNVSNPSNLSMQIISPIKSEILNGLETISSRWLLNLNSLSVCLSPARISFRKSQISQWYFLSHPPYHLQPKTVLALCIYSIRLL